MAFSFSGRTVMITGASAGIGRALTEILHARGAKIIALGRDSIRLKELEKLSCVRTITADLSNRAHVDALIEDLQHSASDLSVLINNAGMQVIVDIAATDQRSAIPSLRD
jgi:NADP-dependent 3-hydroxy acid dehydrogenase YdfG